MELFREFKSDIQVGPVGYKHPKVKLTYSAFMCLSGNPPWFCRIYEDNWDEYVGTGFYGFSEAYGRTKFEAYRKAKSNSLTQKNY